MYALPVWILLNKICVSLFKTFGRKGFAILDGHVRVVFATKLVLFL